MRISSVIFFSELSGWETAMQAASNDRNSWNQRNEVIHVQQQKLLNQNLRSQRCKVWETFLYSPCIAGSPNGSKKGDTMSLSLSYLVTSL